MHLSAAGKYHNKPSAACINHSSLSLTFSSYLTQPRLHAESHVSDFRPTNPIASRAEQIEDCLANKYQSKHPFPQIFTLPHSTSQALLPYWCKVHPQCKMWHSCLGKQNSRLIQRSHTAISSLFSANSK